MTNYCRAILLPQAVIIPQKASKPLVAVARRNKVRQIDIKRRCDIAQHGGAWLTLVSFNV